MEQRQDIEESVLLEDILMKLKPGMSLHDYALLVIKLSPKRIDELVSTITTAVSFEAKLAVLKYCIELCPEVLEQILAARCLNEDVQPKVANF